MKTITSSVVSASVCGLFVDSSAAWQSYGERIWSEMMQTLRQQPVHLKIIGIDSEWFLNLPLAVVQFSTSSHCFVLHLRFFDGRSLPAAVKEALCDPSIIKCGVGVKDDISRLQKEQNITIQSVLDVAEYSALFGLHQGVKSNLKLLASTVANLSIEKKKKIACSNWELPLKKEQVNYAAEDALASYLVGRAVMLKAFQVTDMSADAFNIAEWLHETSPKAAMALKIMKQEAVSLETQRKKETYLPLSKKRDNDKLLTQSGSCHKVSVLDRNGNFIFECSTQMAKFYVMGKSLAVITKHVASHPRDPLEIQLLFDPTVKTQLCIHHKLGICLLQDQCPFAHGMSKLQADAASLIQSEIPSCASCLGTKELVSHAITPPSLRKFMPLPHRQARVDDYLPVCRQCNSILRYYYDKEIERCYREAEKANIMVCDLNVVQKCSQYARLLSSADQLANMLAHTHAELQNFVKQNWKNTFFEDFNPGFKIDEPVEQNVAFLKRLGRISPFDVRSKVTMAVLVGDDEEKAQQFIERWHDYCFNTCGLMKKMSNHVTHKKWKDSHAQKD
ncbi:hypothetical protein, unknown function [Leishmania tarentolae]|uniref:3'-5' exonuclease n=1 Tax=Leishmania tarentolae TaxID=5689 RepID=A0A640KR31_LEITA|nr:hypothetical protein, unknown function [Leishmania tarentolae]